MDPRDHVGVFRFGWVLGFGNKMTPIRMWFARRNITVWARCPLHCAMVQKFTTLDFVSYLLMYV